MREADRIRSDQLRLGLTAYSSEILPLPGVAQDDAQESLVRQMIDSLHRIEYVRRIGDRPIDPRRRDPASDLFDPIKAAHLFLLAGDVDEAAWLVFLSTHFGFHRAHGWELTRRVYGALGSGQHWTWARTSSDPAGFRAWFVANAAALSGIPFGNHRKYESVRVDAECNLADTVESYVKWIGPNRGFALMVADTSEKAGGAEELFDALYSGMSVGQFGRTAKFDYLTMIGKLSLADIEPPSPYFAGASGPVYGAKLLFLGDAMAKASVRDLSTKVADLGKYLGLGMQVMEDALCNWQKAPLQYRPFRG